MRLQCAIWLQICTPAVVALMLRELIGTCALSLTRVGSNELFAFVITYKWPASCDQNMAVFFHCIAL